MISSQSHAPSIGVIIKKLQRPPGLGGAPPVGSRSRCLRQERPAHHWIARDLRSGRPHAPRAAQRDDASLRYMARTLETAPPTLTVTPGCPSSSESISAPAPGSVGSGSRSGSLSTDDRRHRACGEIACFGPRSGPLEGREVIDKGGRVAGAGADPKPVTRLAGCDAAQRLCPAEVLFKFFRFRAARTVSSSRASFRSPSGLGVSLLYRRDRSWRSVAR